MNKGPIFSDREYQELILEAIGRFDTVSKAQHKAMLNTLATIQRTMLDLQQSVLILTKGLEERSEKRYQEEIEDLENRIKGFEKLLEEKKQAQQTQQTNKTSQDIQRIALNTYQEQQTQQLAEQQKQSVARKLKWQDLAIGAIVSYVAVQVVSEVIKLLAK